MKKTASRIPAGLSITKHSDGWYVTHVTSRIPLHGFGFARKADLTAAVAALADLGIDWDQPAAGVRAAVDQTDGGRDAIRLLLTPPEERERQRRVAANASRYLRALEGQGARVVERTSHGLAGTVYRMSCGCHRLYSVTIGGPTSGDPREELVLRCEQHRDLTVDAAT